MAELIQYANGVPGIKWPLDKTIIRIGRSESRNDIVIDDSFASKVHAQIEIVFNPETEHLEYYLRDLESTNHTYHNQKTVNHVSLSHNDTVMIGKSKFVFLIEGTREYVTVEQVVDPQQAVQKPAEEQAASATEEEVTGEFKSPADRENMGDGDGVLSQKSSKNRFSRRLNIY